VISELIKSKKIKDKDLKHILLYILTADVAAFFSGLILGLLFVVKDISQQFFMGVFAIFIILCIKYKQFTLIKLLLKK